jgi:hypothetical protein
MRPFYIGAPLAGVFSAGPYPCNFLQGEFLMSRKTQKVLLTLILYLVAISGCIAPAVLQQYDITRAGVRLRTMLWHDTPVVPKDDNVRALVHVLVPETTTDYSCTGTGTASL